MAIFTTAQCQTQLDAYMAAEVAVLSGQEYEIAGRRLKRADLKTIQGGIDLWSQRLQDAQARASGRCRAVATRPGW